MEIAGQLCAYAATAEEKELCEFADLEATHFFSLPDSEMDDLAMKVHDKAEEVFNAHTATPPAEGSPNFTEYQVNTEKLLALHGLIAAYAKVVPSPREAAVNISAAVDTLEGIKDEQRQVFELRFDKLMKPFKKSAPDFFAKYEKARLIVERGGGKEKAATNAPNVPKDVPKDAPKDAAAPKNGTPNGELTPPVREVTTAVTSANGG